ncbi:hypothetical protein [Alsobacter sp. R-9]
MTGTGIDAFEPLLPAERRIIAELRSGDFDRLGDGTRPVEADPERTVRAELLRFLLLGGSGDVRPHEKGVRVSGGYIVGILDLEGCRVPRDIGLKDCLFEAAPILRSAIIDSLFLDGSSVPGLLADRLEARGDLTLRGADVRGPVELAGARIGGWFEADGASLHAPGGLVVEAPGLAARGVHLRGASVRGGVDLEGARLVAGLEAQGMVLEHPEGQALDADSLETGSNVILRRARIVGEVNLLGSHVSGDLDGLGATFSNPGRVALNLGRATIEGGFLLREGARVEGTLDMTGTSVGTVHDEAEAWPPAGDLLLNRCMYNGFIDGPADAASRLDWLSRQSPARWGEDFWPQPYEQLATVFRDMGHDEDARRVLVEKERLQRAARRARAGNASLRAALGAKDWLLGVTLGYGRQPLLAFLWLLLIWLVGVGVFAQADAVGAMKPNSPVVLRSPEWTACRLPRGQTAELTATAQIVQGRAEPGQTQLACFRSQFEALSYPEFNAWMYSLDTLFPVMEIGQRNYWRPDPAQRWGGVTIAFFYLESILGWALSLLAVAGFSGLVKSN